MSSLTVARAFVRRDFGVARSYRLPFAMELVSTSFMLVLFYFLARVVDEGGAASRFEGMQDGYFPFVVIGMAMFRMLQSMLTTFTTQIRAEQTTGTLAALLTTPTPPAIVILASAAYSLVRAIVSAVLMVVLAVTLGLDLEVTLASGLSAVVTVVGSMALFAAVGIAIAAFTILFKQAQGMVALVMAAISLLSGIYFPVEVLPGWLQAVAKAVPVTTSIDLLRDQLLAGTTSGPQVVGMVAAGAVWLAFAVLLFRVAVDRARAAGALTQF